MTSPTPSQIRDLRISAGLTQLQAEALIGVTLRSWQRYESGERKMSAGLWELFQIKINQKNPKKD